MIPAHLVFADINGHSEMPVERRADVLQRFWMICRDHKPELMRDSPTSFYDIDNDSLMAGFAGVERMYSAREVLLWTVALHRDLAAEDVSVSFGVGLAAGQYAIDWEAVPGFLPELRSHLYYADDIDWPDGRVDRRRLIGDPLIMAARLLSLAKKAQTAIAFALIPGDFQHHERIDSLQVALQEAGVGSVFPLRRDMHHMPHAHQRWMEDFRLEPYGIIRNT